MKEINIKIKTDLDLMKIEYFLSDLDRLVLKVFGKVPETIIKELSQGTQETGSLRNQLIDLIKEADTDGGINTEDIYKKITYEPAQIDKEIRTLLEDGYIFEPKPNKLRWLG